jgi:AbrB family looped-hinge helix DNA binding protein
MKITIDKAGRLVIPKAIRDAMGLSPGTVLDVRCTEGRIEIEPESVPVRLVRRGRLLVAVAEGSMKPLTPEVVERTRDAIARERFPYI